MPHRTQTTLDFGATAKPELTNELLLRVPTEERCQLLSIGVPVHLERKQVLHESGTPRGVVLFPLTCLVSLQTMTEDGAMVEVAMIGREGVIGFPTGQESPHSPYAITVQISGDALRFRAEALRTAFDRSCALRSSLLAYWHALLADVARGSACHCFHTAPQRLSRWLLAASARTQRDTLHMTHEDLASVLGLPRSSVTASALALREAGAIRYHQGRVTILDRRRLTQMACECHRVNVSDA
jgi:CRP-like cAMP-binding protein